MCIFLNAAKVGHLNGQDELKANKKHQELITIEFRLKKDCGAGLGKWDKEKRLSLMFLNVEFCLI